MNFQFHQHRESGRSRAYGHGSSGRAGFTLVEILVVLAIIAILAALLFPAFKGAQENGKQANCASNLQQVYMGVRAYYDDEKKYPASAAVLLPSTEKLDNKAPAVTTPATLINNVPNSCDPASGTCTNVRGTGYIKTTSVLVCPDDDSPAGQPRSSYSNLATANPPALANAAATPPADADLARYVWNYWGYTADGFALSNDDTTTTATSYLGDPTQASSISGDSTRRFLRDPSQPHSAANPVDPLKLPRLANRQAPADTIITHCLYHRLPTSNMAKPTDLYDTTQAQYTSGASDIVLRLDGTAAKADVTTWKAESKWIKQTR